MSLVQRQMGAARNYYVHGRVELKKRKKKKQERNFRFGNNTI